MSSQILPKIDADDEIVWPIKKTSRLKAIGNQIRLILVPNIIKNPNLKLTLMIN